MEKIVISRDQLLKLAYSANDVISEYVAIQVDSAGKLRLFEVETIQKYKPVKISDVTEKGGDYGTASDEM